MSVTDFLQQYWPLLLLAAWFGRKWWNARKFGAMLPYLRAQGAVLLDVRSAAEFAQAHAPGTVNIPLGELSHRLSEVPRNMPVVVCCASGTRSAMAAALLRKHGHDPVFNAGSWSALLPR